MGFFQCRIGSRFEPYARGLLSVLGWALLPAATLYAQAGINLERMPCRYFVTRQTDSTSAAAAQSDSSARSALGLQHADSGNAALASGRLVVDTTGWMLLGDIAEKNEDSVLRATPGVINVERKCGKPRNRSQPRQP